MEPALLSLAGILATLSVSAGLTWLSLALFPAVLRRAAARARVFRGETTEDPVIRLGGVAVVAGTAAGILTALAASQWSGSLEAATHYYWIGWILGAAALFLCGIYDDLHGLGARAKLVFQITGAAAAFAAGFRVDFIALPGLGRFDLGPLAVPATVLWIVAVTNAINLIDGLDGLAGGICLMASATIASVALAQGVFSVAVIGLALAGSLLAFLRFNLHPARFHLGDCGSQFIGFTLAVISLRGFQKSSTAVTLLAPILILGLPLCDTLLVALRRLWKARDGVRAVPGSWLRIQTWRGVFSRDREHVHYNLLDLGFSEKRAVVVLYVTAAALCASALALVFRGAAAAAVLTAAAVVVEIVVLKVLAGRRRVADAPTASREEASLLRERMAPGPPW